MRLEWSGVTARAVKLRHQLHRHPELAWAEFDTARTAAEWLAAHESTLPGPVTLLFQPAEEGGHGAAKMIADGCLAGAPGSTPSRSSNSSPRSRPGSRRRMASMRKSGPPRGTAPP